MTQKHTKKKNNVALVDGQNLYISVKNAGWDIDLLKFRRWLKEKYGVDKAYYFIGYTTAKHQELYTTLQQAGFILIVKNEYPETFQGADRYRKRDNVDSDVVFYGMKELRDNKDLNKIVLVSCDGDFIKMVRYLIEIEKFEKVIFPSESYSSLYKELGNHYAIILSKNKERLKKV